MRTELKKEIIPTPSKLTEEEVNQYFSKLFVKITKGSDEYYVPIKNKVELPIDEELFKGLIKKPKTKETKMKEKDMKKEQEKEIAKNIALSLYKKFENEYVKPYVEKRRAKEDTSKEEKAMIDRYIKYGEGVKKLVKEQLPKTWATILNPAYEEREKRKAGLKEEEMKLKDMIKKEARNK